MDIHKQEYIELCEGEVAAFLDCHDIGCLVCHTCQKPTSACDGHTPASERYCTNRIGENGEPCGAPPGGCGCNDKPAPAAERCVVCDAPVADHSTLDFKRCADLGKLLRSHVEIACKDADALRAELEKLRGTK